MAGVLDANRVIELLEHDDVNVRRNAIHYFAYASDPTPLLPSDVFRVLDRYQMDVAEILFWDFPRLPQSAESAQRLRELAHLESVPPAVRRAIAGLDPDVTDAWPEATDGSTLNREVRELIAFRQEIRDRDPRELWQMHQASFLEQDPNQPWVPNTPRYDALVAELRRSPMEAGALAVGTLEYWSRLWCRSDYPGPEEEGAYVWLTGSSHPDALPILLRASFGPEQRLTDHAIPALRRHGEAAFDAVVRAYVTRLQGSSPYTIGEFRVPQVEDVLIDLLLRETDDYERTIIGMALCLVFPTKGLPHLLDVVLRGDWMPRMEPLDHLLVMAAKAAEWDAPGLSAVIDEVARQEQEHESIPPSGRR